MNFKRQAGRQKSEPPRQHSEKSEGIQSEMDSFEAEQNKTTMSILDLSIPHGTAREIQTINAKRIQQSRGNSYLQRVIQRDGHVVTSKLGGGIHIVTAGDSLWSIAQQKYGDGKYWQNIYRTNYGKIGSGGSLILIGSELDMPEIEVPVASTNLTGKNTDNETLASTSATGSTQSNLTNPETMPRGSSQEMISSDRKQAQNGMGFLTSGALAKTCLLPAFRYNLKRVPIPVAPMPVPGGVIIYTLSLRGDVTTQKQGQCLPWSIDQTGLRLEATEVINQFTAGIRINHIGSGAMSLGTTFAGPFHSTEVRYTPPSTMTFIAQTRNFGFEFSGWRVNGNFGYEMRADFVPQPPQAELVYPPPGVEEPQISWDKILRNPTVVSLVVGSVAIAVGTIVEDILTAGGGIADDVVSFTLAAKMLRMAQVAATGI